MRENLVFPFTAVVGQDYLKKALILSVINPLIGGALISGEKGTAKSTLVRGIALLMKPMELIEVPLNTTEDNLIGSIDVEKAVISGKKIFKEGLLKKANNNILYIDEVNLLSEHIVNCLLEVSAMGVNNVERGGMSYSHISKFSIIGTMNPEEGNLRSAFLDKFGLYVNVSSSNDALERAEIIKRRLEFEKNPKNYKKIYNKKEQELKKQISEAKKILKNVRIEEEIINFVADLCIESNCSGHRAELVIIETAKAIAALNCKDYININDIKEAANYALPHRIREVSNNSKEHKERKNKVQHKKNKENNERHRKEESKKEYKNQYREEKKIKENNKSLQEKNNEQENLKNQFKDKSQEKSLEKLNFKENIEDINKFISFKINNIKPLDRKFKKIEGIGKRLKSKTDLLKGRYIRYDIAKERLKDIAFDATLRAAAPYQKLRKKNGLAFNIKESDFRKKIREHRTGTTIIFVVDASGSMGAKKRMREVKGTILSMLTDAYEKRDKIAMIAFRREKAEILLNVTRSVDLAQKCLKELPTGGKTPLSAGLYKAYELINLIKRKEPNTFPVIVLLSDGRTNVAQNNIKPLDEALMIARKIRYAGIYSIVIDTEEDFIKLHLAKELAKNMDGEYYKLDNISAKEITKVVKKYI